MNRTEEVKNTMDPIEMENIRIQINELTKLITDLKIMRASAESVEMLKKHKELYIYKASELLNAFFDKFYNIEQGLDDIAFYFQNLVENLEQIK
jgi:hypothetical protein